MWFAIGLIILGVLALYAVAVITSIMAFMFSPWLGIIVALAWIVVLAYFEHKITN